MPFVARRNHPAQSQIQSGVLATMQDNAVTFEELVPFLAGFLITFIFQVLRYFALRTGGEG